MITLYRRGQVYWTRRCEFSKEIRSSLHTRDKEVAKLLVRQMEIDLLSGGRLREVLWPAFQEEFLQWIEPQVKPSTIRGYRITAKRFGRFLESSNALQVKLISLTTIAAFLEERRSDKHPSTKRHPGPGGIKFDLRCLRRIFGYAIECGYMTTNPVRQRNLGSSPRGTLPFSQDDIAAMLKHSLNPQQRAIIMTFLHTGLRIGDVIRLTKHDVKGGTLHLNTRKRDKVVTLRVHPELRKALDAHFAAQGPVQRRSRYAFTTETGKPIVSLARDLRRLWKRAGISGAHAHRFRDTIAVRLLSQGASLYDVAKILGNTAAVVEKYYAPFVRELQNRSAKLIEKLAFV